MVDCLVLAEWDSRVFEQLSYNSLRLQQRCQCLHVFTTRVSVKFRRATEQRLAWLFSFLKMTNILRQCPFGGSFPAGAKMLDSPTNQMAACTCSTLRHHHYILNCAPKLQTSYGRDPATLHPMAAMYLLFSLLICLQTMQVNLVWYPELCNNRKTISSRLQHVCNQPGGCTRACISHYKTGWFLFFFLV